MIARQHSAQALIPTGESAQEQLTVSVGARGFTLVEVLLGLLIFSFIAAGLYGTFRGGLAVSRRVQEVNTGYKEIRWILEQMASDFENTVYYDFIKSYPNLKSFEADADTIRMLVASPDGLVMVSYALQEPAANSVFKTIVNRKAKKLTSMVAHSQEINRTKLLVRTEQPLRNFFGQGTQGMGREVLSFLVRKNGLHFFYTNGALLPNKEISWQSTWDDPSVPSMVKVDLVLANFESGSGDFSLSREFWIPMGSSAKLKQ